MNRTRWMVVACVLAMTAVWGCRKRGEPVGQVPDPDLPPKQPPPKQPIDQPPKTAPRYRVSLPKRVSPCVLDETSEACRERRLSIRLKRRTPNGDVVDWHASDCKNEPDGDSCQYAAMRSANSPTLIRGALDNHPAAPRHRQAGDFDADGWVTVADLVVLDRLMAQRDCVRWRTCEVW